MFKVITIKLIKLLVYYFSLIVPRDKDVWVFKSRSSPSGNQKYLFYELIYCNKNLKLVWILDEPSVKDIEIIKKDGGFIYDSKSLKAFYYLLRAGVYVSDTSLSSGINDKSLPWFTRGRAKWINTWHGVPFKTLGNNIPGKRRNKFKLWVRKMALIEKANYPSVFIVPEYKYVDYFSNVFDLDVNNIVVMPYPRNKVLYDKDFYDFVSERNLFDKENYQGFSKVILYAPTWRDNKLIPFTDPGFEKEVFIDYIKKNNMLLLFKPHPMQLIEERNIEHVNNLENVCYLEKSIDLYLILPLVDVLITDYSSIYFDYKYVENSTTIFYMYDIDEYRKARGFDFEIKDYSDDIYVYDMKNLLLALKKTVHKDSPNSAEQLYINENKVSDNYLNNLLSFVDSK